jgi:hypothetical protein
MRPFRRQAVGENLIGMKVGIVGDMTDAIPMENGGL